MNQQNNAVSELRLKRITNPDADGFFQSSSYKAIPDSTLVSEESIHFKLNQTKIRAPKHLAAEIQARIFEQTQRERAELHKEDVFQKEVNLMPYEQKSIHLRNVVRQCVICGGPHAQNTCPLKQQQKMQFDRPSRLQATESTFSVKIEPLPSNWERQDIIVFVQEASSRLREEQSIVQVAVADAIKEMSEAKSDTEKSLIDHKRKQLQAILDEKIKALSEIVPKRVTVLTDKKITSARYAFIHFQSKLAADNFARIKEKTFIQGEQMFMHAICMGEFKKK